MEITLNGTPVTTQAENLAQLVEEQGIAAAGTAIAVGARVVRRADWMQTPLTAQCVVTVIRATQGG